MSTLMVAPEVLAYCLLPTAYCPLPTAYCLLPGRPMTAQFVVVRGSLIEESGQ